MAYYYKDRTIYLPPIEIKEGESFKTNNLFNFYSFCILIYLNFIVLKRIYIFYLNKMLIFLQKYQGIIID